MTREAVLSNLRNAMSAALGEVRQDPEFLGKVVNTICTELGMDGMASMYLSNRIKNLVRKPPGV